jgi:nucleotide-binding universal stress UspA family protein
MFNPGHASDQASPPVPERVRWVGAPAPSGVTASLVVGHDRHPGSRRVLEVAADLAARLNAHLHVVHAVDLSDYPIDPDSPDWEDRAASVLTADRDDVREQLAARSGGWTYHAGRADPVHLINAVADECDAVMVVVGTRGSGPRATVQRLFDGSVSHKLIGHQHRPVLVVPSG